jgi:predicted Na+-dependent transporter
MGKLLKFTLLNQKQTIMNIKRIFGSILTLLGIIGLIYAAYVFANTGGQTKDIKSLIIYGILGIVFFLSGISLVRNTKDES